MKVLAVDYGSKSVGIASGDSASKIAFPKCVIQNRGDEYVVDEILKICVDEGYKEVVFGLPYGMDGDKSEQYEVINKFVEMFKTVVNEGNIDLSVKTIDEGLSSFEADQYLDDFKDKKVRKEVGDRDMMAAKIILERYFS